MKDLTPGRAMAVIRTLAKGCGDNSCLLQRPGAGGMGTNGGCRCHDRLLDLLRDLK